MPIISSDTSGNDSSDDKDIEFDAKEDKEGT